MGFVAGMCLGIVIGIGVCYPQETGQLITQVFVSLHHLVLQMFSQQG